MQAERCVGERFRSLVPGVVVVEGVLQGPDVREDDQETRAAVRGVHAERRPYSSRRCRFLEDERAMGVETRTYVLWAPL